MPAKSRSSAADALTVRLAVAIKRLHSRLREAALGSSGMELPIAQLAIIKRLRDGGPTTAAVLAAAEHVSHQAIAQNLAALKQAGLVRTAPDPTDGRKSLVHITAAGQSAVRFGGRVAQRLAGPRDRAERPRRRTRPRSNAPSCCSSASPAPGSPGLQPAR